MKRNCIVTALGALMMTTRVFAQTPPPPEDFVVPQNATALQGLPQVRIDTAKDNVSRRELNPAEAAGSRLTIAIVDGRFYWGERRDSPLTVSTSGGFTYLTSAEPGRYVRLQRLNETVTYVEHVDMGNRSVTYWGELRIVLGK
jgi:hypothetical protein